MNNYILIFFNKRDFHFIILILVHIFIFNSTRLKNDSLQYLLNYVVIQIINSTDGIDTDLLILIILHTVVFKNKKFNNYFLWYFLNYVVDHIFYSVDGIGLQVLIYTFIAMNKKPFKALRKWCKKKYEGY